jgi:hypothetical protein
MEVSGSRQVSSHQVVKDKRIAGIVEEQFRAWSLSDAYWDSWGLTVECANESTDGWTISAASSESLAQLVANWAKRYGFWPQREGDPSNWTVYGHREIYAIFGGSYPTACPGGMDLDWITKRAQQILKPQTKKRTITMPILYRQVTGQTPAYTGVSFLVGDSGKVLRIDEKTYPGWAQLKYDMEVAGLAFTAYGDHAALSTAFAAVAPPAGGTVDPAPIAAAAAVGAKAGATEAITAAKIPSAVENGAAARAAIVKP